MPAAFAVVAGAAGAPCIEQSHPVEVRSCSAEMDDESEGASGRQQHEAGVPLS